MPSKRIPTGQTIGEFGFCVNRKYKNSDGAWQEEKTFLEVICWAKLAEVVAKYCKKGSLIFIGGRLKFDSWDDKQSGQKRSARYLERNITFGYRQELSEKADSSFFCLYSFLRESKNND